MAREPIPTWYFALVVVQHEDRFLLVQERKHGQLWYLPAGRVEPGETLAAGAIRETLEESGVAVRLTGIIRIEHTPQLKSARVRVIFTAEPSGDPTPKSEPDDESLAAEWVRLSDLDDYALRGEEVRALFEHVARGGPVYPLEVLQPEFA